MRRILGHPSFWVILGLVGIFSCWFGPWRFQTNDDVLMMWLVSGAYTGEPERYAVFIHPSLSWVLSNLYSLFPEFNWYASSWYLFVGLAYISLVRLSFHLRIPESWREIILGLSLIISLHFCLFLQFTIVAGWVGLVGFICFYSSFKTNQEGYRVLGLVLIFFSLLIRWEATGLVLLSLLVFFWLSDKQGFRRQFTQVLFLGILFLGVISSKVIYEQTSIHADYVEFNRARSSVLDHPVYYHLSREEIFPSESEWHYFRALMIDSLEIGVDDLEDKRSQLDQMRWDPKYLTKSIERLWTVLKTEQFKSVFGLLFIALFLFSNIPGRIKLQFSVGWMIFFLVMNFWFVLQGRVIVLFLIPFLILLLSSINSGESRIQSSWILVLASTLFFLHLINISQGWSERKEIQDEYLALAKIGAERGVVFTEDLYEFNLPMGFHSENIVPSLTYGWISKSPFQEKALLKRGISSFDRVDSYSLINYKNQETLIFPLYMNHLNSTRFELIDFQETSKLQFFEFSRP